MDNRLLSSKDIYRYIVLYIHDKGKGYKEFSRNNPIQENENELKEISKKIEHLDRVKGVFITRVVLDNL